MPGNLLLLDEDLDLSGFISASVEQESRESEGRNSLDRMKIMDEIKKKKLVKEDNERMNHISISLRTKNNNSYENKKP